MELIRLTARLVLFTGFMGLTATLAGTLLLVETLLRCQIDRAPFARICFNGASRCLGFRISTQGTFSNRPVRSIGCFVVDRLSLWGFTPQQGKENH